MSGGRGCTNTLHCWPFPSYWLTSAPPMDTLVWPGPSESHPVLGKHEPLHRHSLSVDAATTPRACDVDEASMTPLLYSFAAQSLTPLHVSSTDLVLLLGSLL